jgi:hypothetical protein
MMLIFQGLRKVTLFHEFGHKFHMQAKSLSIVNAIQHFELGLEKRQYKVSIISLGPEQ